MAFEFDRITPEKAGISSYRILDFLSALESVGTEMHGMMLLKGNSIFAEGHWRPYNNDDPHIMFSFTKSLTSTAIGFAVSEGVISLDDKLVDIFPDKLPKEVNENLKKADIRSLLTMSCGHDTEMGGYGIDVDYVAEFLKHPFEHEPGTYFRYNTAGTNILCAVLLRKTGEKLTDYLKPRLFDKLSMGDVYCAEISDGILWGGAGSFLTTEQMAKFIRFIANRGVWEGERLLPEAWFDLACGYQIDNTPTQSNPDWVKGYGFQFWQCVPEGVFRADGAFGQYGIVVLDKDLVFIFQSASSTMQDTLTVTWDYLLKYIGEKPLPEDEKAYAALKYKLDNLEISHPISKKNPESFDKFDGLELILNEEVKTDLCGLIGGSGMYFAKNQPKKNASIKNMTISITDEALTITTDSGEVLPIATNARFNSFSLNGNNYGAVGTWSNPEAFEFLVYCTSAASGVKFRLELGENPRLLADSTLLNVGGIGGNPPETITFTKGNKNGAKSDYKPYFAS